MTPLPSATATPSSPKLSHSPAEGGLFLRLQTTALEAIRSGNRISTISSYVYQKPLSSEFVQQLPSEEVLAVARILLQNPGADLEVARRRYLQDKMSEIHPLCYCFFDPSTENREAAAALLHIYFGLHIETIVQAEALLVKVNTALDSLPPQEKRELLAGLVARLVKQILIPMNILRGEQPSCSQIASFFKQVDLLLGPEWKWTQGATWMQWLSPPSERIFPAPILRIGQLLLLTNRGITGWFRLCFAALAKYNDPYRSSLKDPFDRREWDSAFTQLGKVVSDREDLVTLLGKMKMQEMTREKLGDLLLTYLPQLEQEATSLGSDWTTLLSHSTEQVTHLQQLITEARSRKATRAASLSP